MAAQQDRTSRPQPAVRPGDPLNLAESVAGEEDPGASLDLALAPAAAPAPAVQPPEQHADLPSRPRTGAS